MTRLAAARRGGRASRRALIRLDTSNPPGNETPAAELIAEYLEAAGVECELVGPDPERLNLVARIAGSGRGPSMMLLAHTDVVPAPVGQLDRATRSGATVTDGRLIGRGAVDMKNELAARVVARRRARPHRRAPGGRRRARSPRPTRSATSPTSACHGSCASGRTCAATSRSTRAAACCSSSPAGARA